MKKTSIIPEESAKEIMGNNSERLQRLHSKSNKNSLRKKSSLQRGSASKKNNKACFILTEYQENILFQKNKVILFLTIDYKYNCYYWETFFYFTNLVISLLFTFSKSMGLDINIIGAAIILLYLFMLLITETKRPFKYEFINNLACFSYIASILNVSFCLMSSLKENSNAQNRSYLVLIVMTNVGYLILWVYSFNSVKKKIYMPQLKKFFYFVLQKFK